MSFTATTASLQKRTEEAIRYAIDYTLGRWGYVYATATATATITIALDSDLTLTTGDTVLVGSQSRTITTLTPIFPSVPQRYTAVLSAAVTAAVSDVVRLDYSENVRRSDDMRSIENLTPLIVVQVLNLKESWAGSPHHSGTLVVGIDSVTNTIESDDGDAVTNATNATQSEAHQLLIQQINAILLDAQTIADLTMFAAVRPVSDWTLKGLYDSEEPGGGFDSGRHVFEVRKRIVVSREDEF